ncbi:MAG: winged helix DNA-binding domain-containing protein [Anaerolineae bacterium]|nr:winged helix DNA-binding domain-containing protein [Anaerolineae bacterium]
MPEQRLTLKALNRATLARQMLLERAEIPIPAAVEQLVGLQAQLAVSPYIGLWTRLRDFQREDLAQFIEQRVIVKATLMRATLHLFTAADYLRLRGTIQLALDRAFESITLRRDQTIDIPAVLAAADAFLKEKPRPFADLSAMLTEAMPDSDVGAMRYTVRTQIPLVQVPIQTGWSYPGNPDFALAESWLGQPIPTESDLRALVFRYLAAFGPATVTDFQTWFGANKLKEALNALKPDLRILRDERGRELLDLPDAPLPDAETPAPVRFLPEYDNLLLAHQDRTRILDDAYRSQVYLPGLRVRSTFLVDGSVRGAWKIEKQKGAATLTIEPFEPLSAPDRAALGEEGERLVRFVESSAKAYVVQFAE